jgi:hypothetical protein
MRRSSKEEFVNKANKIFNNINLIRIPYWEFDNIEEILDRELNLERKANAK